MNGKTNNPIFCLAERKSQGVLALVTATEGPSYRSVGASMVFMDDGTRIGSLSSGCIESDLWLHAKEVRASEAPKVITYGVGSPFIDIKLPCGGALEILLLPQPSNEELDLIRGVLSNRIEKTITISKRTGHISADVCQEEAWDADRFRLNLIPPLRFCVFGKGPEALNFTQLAMALGYEGKLLSPDPETINTLPKSEWESILLRHRACPSDLSLDRHTAVVLFFHDHDWEAPILKGILESDAFYIGAQGSKRAGESRSLELDQLGVSASQRARIVGPIGLIPSTRDPQTLAVSVLAEILHKAQTP
jgi:xanthine dehydrogenase accessory factor